MKKSRISVLLIIVHQSVSDCDSCDDILKVWEEFKASTNNVGQGGEILIDEVF